MAVSMGWCEPIQPSGPGWSASTAYRASDRGYAAAFVAVAVIALAGMVLTALLVKRPATSASKAGETARSELTG